MGTLDPQQQVDVTPAPAWRSLPFYNCVEASSSSAAFAGQPVSQVHTIFNLGCFPLGIHPIDGYHHGKALASTTVKPPPPLDCPHLVTLTNGLLVLVDPATLSPLAPPFPSIQDAAVTHVHYDAVSSLLVILSEDKGGTGFPLLRIWDLKSNLASLKSRQGEQGEDGLWVWRPRLMAEGRVQHGRKPFPIAAVAVTSGMGYLACSLANGAVLLLRKLSATLSTAPLPTSANQTGPAVSLPKFKVVYQPGAEITPSTSSSNPPEQEPVTALAFSYSGDESHPHSNHTLSLFIATLSRVMRYTVLGKGAGSSPITLDDIGSPLGCSVLLPPTSSTGAEEGRGTYDAKLLIARPEAIYTIGASGREDCYAYEGPKDKVFLLPVSRSLVIISPPLSRDKIAALGPSQGIGAGPTYTNGDSHQQSGQEFTKISIFDLDGKFLSYSGTFPGAIRAAFPDHSPTAADSSHREDIFILSEAGALYQLSERPLREKIEILYRKHLFLLAAQVAKSHFARSTSSSAVAAGDPDLESNERLNALLGEIWIKYGDHLYEKGDHEGSMKMGYLKSVGAFAGAVGATSRGRRRGRPKAGVGESYIIRKFLDAQRIPLLTLYLQELHRRGLANSDHTTLLLNCYTKMKDTSALDRFIRRSHINTSGDADAESSDDDASSAGHSDANGKGTLPFDLPTAINVCRSANYFSQAAYLARKFGLGEEYLRIKIEDTNEPLEAIEWLRTREAAEVVEYLRTYAGLLLSGSGGSKKEEAERQTTDLLIELCAGAYRPHVSNSSGAIEQAAKAAKGAGEGGVNGKGFLSYLTGANTVPTGESPTDVQGKKNAAKDAPYILNATGSAATSTHAGEGGGDALAVSTSAPYEVPSARQFFPHFIRHPNSFRRFLETVALARWGQAVDLDAPEEDMSIANIDAGGIWEAEDHLYEDDHRREQRSIWNTLLEIYLVDGRRVASNSKAITASLPSTGSHSLSQDLHRALSLLRQYRHLPYDVSHALILCEQENFTEGIVTLYERLGMYEDILTLWMEKARQELTSIPNDSEVSSPVSTQKGEVIAQAGNKTEGCPSSSQVLKALALYHTQSPNLYTQVLTFLISHPLLIAKHRIQIEDILVQIEEERLMSTLEIVELLSKEGGYANVGLIREFLEARVREEREEEEADQRLISSYRSETSRKEREMEELTRGEPRVFQSNRCTACGGQLDLPAVHFMCKHSYHARCLGETENECPSCARAYGVIREIRRNNEEMASRHDLFLKEIRESDDPFLAIASMFGKGVFSPNVLSSSSDVGTSASVGGGGGGVGIVNVNGRGIRIE